MPLIVIQAIVIITSFQKPKIKSRAPGAPIYMHYGPEKRFLKDIWNYIQEKKTLCHKSSRFLMNVVTDGYIKKSKHEFL